MRCHAPKGQKNERLKVYSFRSKKHIKNKVQLQEVETVGGGGCQDGWCLGEGPADHQVIYGSNME